MLRRAVIAAFAIALFSSPSAAIRSDPLPRVCNEFRDSDYVFSGRVLSEKSIWPRRLHGEGVTIYRIRVDHVFKGKVHGIASVYTGNDSGRGVLNVGQRAAVLAQRYEGRMYFSGSSNSQSGAGTSKVLTDIRQYLRHPPTVTTISGRLDRLPGVAPFGSARMLITNGKTRHFVRTDRKGMFLVSVAPGTWSAQIAEPGWASRTGVYTYDDADKMKLGKGDCADLQIETAAPGEKLEGRPLWKRWPR